MVIQIKQRKLYIFHALHPSDLDKIIEMSHGEPEGFLIAPSIGITKKRSILDKFGSICFLMTKAKLLSLKCKIYERDIWSPTFKDVPDEILVYNPKGIEQYTDRMVRMEDMPEGLPRITTIGNIIKFALKENPHDPIQTAINYLNDESIYKLFQREINQDENFLYNLAIKAFVKVPKNKDTITRFFKTHFNELRGQDAFAYAYAIAARKVPRSKFDEVADKILADDTSKIDFKTIEDQQWKEINNLMLLGFWQDKFSFDAQSVAGDLMSKGTYKAFLEAIKVYAPRTQDERWKNTRINDEILLARADRSLAPVGGLQELYKRLKSVLFDIPSEYMEAKFLDPLPINTFNTCLIPKTGSVEIKEKLSRLNFKGDIITYKESVNKCLAQMAKK